MSLLRCSESALLMLQTFPLLYCSYTCFLPVTYPHLEKEWVFPVPYYLYCFVDVHFPPMSTFIQPVL